jgi:simple sugar transport system ATP-binding protein
MSIVFISHKLYEVMAISDRITVLRDGQAVGTVERAATNQAELARMMVGREMFGVVRQGEYAQGVALRIEDLCAYDEKGLLALNHINLDVSVAKSWVLRCFWQWAGGIIPGAFWDAQTFCGQDHDRRA